MPPEGQDPTQQPGSTPPAASAPPATTTPPTTPPASAEPDTVEKLPEWTQKLIQDLRSENAGHRTKLKGFEDEKEAAERAKLSKEEQLQAERDEARKEAQAAKKLARDLALKSAFTTAAIEHGIKHVDAAYKLADLSAVEFDQESGAPKDVKKLVETVAKANPFLLASGEGTSSTNAARGSGQGGRTVEDIRNELYGTSRNPFDTVQAKERGGGVRGIDSPLLPQS